MSAKPCGKCGKGVYPLEMVVACDKSWHKQCFRCTHCDLVISLKGFATIDGNPYCKPHYLELFKTKGSYKVFSDQDGGASSSYNASQGFKGYGSAEPQKSPVTQKATTSSPTPTAAAAKTSSPVTQKSPTPAAKKTVRVGFAEDADTSNNNREELLKQVEKEDKQLKHQGNQNDRSSPVIEPVSVKQVDRKSILKQGIVENPPSLRNTEDFVNDRSEPNLEDVDSSGVLKTPPQKALFQEIKSVDHSSALKKPDAPSSSPSSSSSSSPASASPKTGGGANKCAKCGKTVYELEMVRACDKQYHKQCFRCKHCDGVLSLKGFAVIENEPYCKPHYLEIFKTKGNYNTFSNPEASASGYNASQGFKGY